VILMKKSLLESSVDDEIYKSLAMLTLDSDDDAVVDSFGQRF